VEANSQAFSGRRNEMISALSAAEAQTFIWRRKKKSHSYM